MAFTVKNTRRAAPMRMIVHGPPGVGKSTFAASAPNPIFISSEDGLDEINAAAVEPAPKTFEEVISAIEYVATLDHETVILDSLDWLEPLVWDYTVRLARSSKIKGIEDFGYGKGYVAALDNWRVLIKRLELLRVKGMNVLLISHSARKMFKNPLGDDYERWTIKLHEKATDLFIEWSRIIAFCDFDVATEDTSGRTKAQATGRRVLRAMPNPAFVAKSRTAERPLPDRIPLERTGGWSVFAKALAAAGDADDEATAMRLREAIEERIRELRDDEIETKVREHLKASGESVATLTEAVERLDITIGARRKAS